MKRKISFKEKKTKKPSIEDVFNKMEDHAEITYCGKGNGTTCQNCFEISWTEKDRGFGTYTFVQDMKGNWKIDNECDGKAAIKRAMERLIDSLPLMDEPWKKELKK